MNHEHNLARRAALFKALGHPARLLMLNLMRERSRHGEELAAILSLNPATVSHHLAKLTEAGLVTPRREQYYQVYSLRGDLLRKTLMDLVQVPHESFAGGVEEDAFRARVLHAFFKHGRLTHVPAQRRKAQIVLEVIAAEFEPGRKYEEREVNHILLEFNEDFASLRRQLIEYKLLDRDQGLYWRVEN
jgi:DNA-binding HxlR family transcriptional regulator